jgi:hypothetical protein
MRPSAVAPPLEALSPSAVGWFLVREQTALAPAVVAFDILVVKCIG